MKKCSSCGTEVLKAYSEFACPNCGKTKIVRCKSCRVLGSKYNCSGCDFTGP